MFNLHPEYLTEYQLYITRAHKGALAVRGDGLILTNKLLIMIKRILFTASKNIIESRSYEQIMNGPHVVEMTTTRARATHVRVAMRALTTISYITHSIVTTPMFPYSICTWAPFISITTIPLHAQNPEL